MRIYICPIIILLFSFQLTQSQIKLTLQPDASEGKDALLHGHPDAANTNFGTSTQFCAAAWTASGSNFTTRSVVDFNLSSIPNNATIISAYLSLYSIDEATHGMGQHDHIGNTNECYLQRITSPWDEKTVTWDNQPTCTAINQILLPSTSSANQNFENIDVKILVQDMIDYHENSFGFMLKLQNEELYRRVNFCTSNHANASLHPKLIITYTKTKHKIKPQNTAYITINPPHDTLRHYISIIKNNVYKDYKQMYRKEKGSLVYPFLTPGSNQYDNVLWDWDSWLSNIALRQILVDVGTTIDKQEAIPYEQGCVLNFLHYGNWDGYLPIVIWENSKPRDIKPADIYNVNMHKPVIAQHAAFLTKQNAGNAEWLREKFFNLQAFENNYKSHHRNKATGLYYWQSDVAIGVDNDPCTFFRPAKSSASIYLNCLMYKELQAMVYLARCLNLSELGKEWNHDAEDLKKAIQENCWDERDGFFYSVDLNLRPITNEVDNTLGLPFIIHSGYPRDYDCLIQRIEVWSGFLAMWAGIATPQQAERIVNEHYSNVKTFNSPSGVRTLSKMEKMYSLRSSANPSNWRGPVWGISNYLVFKGMVKYGYTKEATELATKTIYLFGKDFEKNGALHEYYEPETGEPLLNKGFQNWNYLVVNMIAWLDGKEIIEEF